MEKKVGVEKYRTGTKMAYLDEKVCLKYSASAESRIRTIPSPQSFARESVPRPRQKRKIISNNCGK